MNVKVNMILNDTVNQVKEALNYHHSNHHFHNHQVKDSKDILLVYTASYNWAKHCN